MELIKDKVSDQMLSRVSDQVRANGYVTVPIHVSARARASGEVCWQVWNQAFAQAREQVTNNGLS